MLADLVPHRLSERQHTHVGGISDNEMDLHNHLPPFGADANARHAPATPIGGNLAEVSAVETRDAGNGPRDLYQRLGEGKL